MGVKPILDLPQNSVAEITLIGTGGGYGESCILHLGNQNWVVIDSCINPNTKKSLSLEYLQQLNVNLKTDVKLIACTHWHMDHIQGLSQLLSECESANFACARANDRKKFLVFVALDYEKLDSIGENSSTEEFVKCLNIIRDRGKPYIEAIKDKPLFTVNISDSIKSELIALSPSDYTVQEFDKEISTLITEFGVRNKKVVIKKPNYKSVAMFVKLGPHRVILGADLEVSKNNYEGWLNILDNNLVIDSKASLIKLPHHASENGYHPRIWSELLEKDPIAKLTPWNKGSKLPTPEMLIRYCNHSQSVYMTSPVINDEKPKKRDKRIQKMLDEFNIKLQEVKFSRGIVRCRVDFNNPVSQWKIDFFEKAFHVNTTIA